MTTTKHTPGPWTVIAGVHSGDVVSPLGRVAMGISMVPDARLIAAAPALLEALEAAYMVLNSLDPDDSPGGRLSGNTVATIRAAIDLARGEP